MNALSFVKYYNVICTQFTACDAGYEKSGDDFPQECVACGSGRYSAAGAETCTACGDKEDTDGSTTASECCKKF